MRSPLRFPALAAVGFIALPMTMLLSAPATGAATSGGLAAAPISTLGAVTATGCPAGLTAGNVISPTGGKPFAICSGRVRSFDGTPLDTDVSIPVVRPGQRRPLMIFMHGWGN